MSPRVHISALIIGVLGVLPVAEAQTRSFRACTSDAIVACADLRFTAGANTLEIGIRAVGSSSNPALPLSFYNLVIGTGSAAAISPATRSIVPVASGGAVVSDASPWELFDTGDLLFLSALSNRGVGGCVSGVDKGGFGQAVTTCGNNQFALFSFSPLTALNPNLFTIFDLEGVVLTNDVPGVSCGSEDAACVISNIPAVVTTTPEPGTLWLFGLSLLACVPLGRRGIK